MILPPEVCPICHTAVAPDEQLPYIYDCQTGDYRYMTNNAMELRDATRIIQLYRYQEYCYSLVHFENIISCRVMREGVPLNWWPGLGNNAYQIQSRSLDKTPTVGEILRTLQRCAKTHCMGE